MAARQVAVVFGAGLWDGKPSPYLANYFLGPSGRRLDDALAAAAR